MFLLAVMAQALAFCRRRKKALIPTPKSITKRTKREKEEHFTARKEKETENKKGSMEKGERNEEKRREEREFTFSR